MTNRQPVTYSRRVVQTLPALNENDIYYLTEVLGLRSILLPDLPSFERTNFEAAVSNEARQSQPPVAVSRLRGDLGASSLLCVFAGSDQLPLDSAAEELAHKMIQAMKLNERDVVWLEWTGSESAPIEIRDVALSAGFRPVLCFGEAAARGLLDSNDSSPAAPLGQFVEWHGLKVMTTFSLAELVAQPLLKKQAWGHLQKVMKVLE